MTRCLITAGLAVTALTSVLLAAGPAGAAVTVNPAPTSLVLGTNGIAGFKADKPDVSHGPQTDGGCKAVGGKVLTLERGGVEVQGALMKVTGASSNPTVSFVEDLVDEHTTAALAGAALSRIRNEAVKCGISLNDNGKPTGKVTISRPPAVKGLTPFARFSISGADLDGLKGSVTLDTFRTGRYVLAVAAFTSKLSNGKGVLVNSGALQLAADRAAGAKLVKATS